MKPKGPKQPLPTENYAPSTSDPDAIVQIKAWLLGISPMVWRRVLVPSGFTLHELHGVLQVAMGWEGVHLYQFSLRATRYGSPELSASSPDVTLAVDAAAPLGRGTQAGPLPGGFEHRLALRVVDPSRTRMAATAAAARVMEAMVQFAPSHSGCKPMDIGARMGQGGGGLVCRTGLRPFHSGACGKLAARRSATEVRHAREGPVPDHRR